MLKVLLELKFLSNVSIRLTSALLGLCLTIVLARILEPEQFGVYSYVLSIVWLLSIPAQLGLPALTMRETAAGLVQSEFGRIRGILIWSRVFVVVSTSVIVMIAVLTVTILTDLVRPEVRPTLFLGLVLVPLFAFITLDREMLRGLGRVRIAQVSNEILRPALLILLLLVVGIPGLSIDDSMTAIALHVLAAAVALGVGTTILARAHQKLISPHLTEYHTRAWLLAIVPLGLAAGMQQLLKQMDMAMLGAISGDFTEAGLYRIAVQGATLLLFLQSALNMPLAPKFAQLYKAGNRSLLQRIAVNSSRAIVLPTVLGTALFIVFGETLIALFFGVQYVPAKQPLVILAVAQCINGSFGSVGVLLNMSGHERKNLLGVSLGLGINIVLNATLIPLYGMNGAAVATAISLVIWKVFLWWQVRNSVGINCSAFIRGEIKEA